MSTYAGTFAGYTIAFINADFYFLSESSHFVLPANTLAKDTYLRVCFRFDKGGTLNIQGRTFHRFPVDRPSFCSLLAALRALDCCASCDLDPLTPIFCCINMKAVNFIHESVVTKELCKATLQAYPNPHHFYNLHLKDYTQSAL